MWQDIMWVGVPRGEIESKGIFEGDMNGRFAYYRCSFQLEGQAQLTLNITANSRYRLWVNQKPVLSGPCKGDRFRQYYETVDVSEQLRTGKNTLAVQVLYGDPNCVTDQGDARAPLFFLAAAPAGHRLAIEGVCRDADGNPLAVIHTGVAPWKVYLDNSYFVTSKEANINLGSICEDVDLNALPYGWKEPDFDDSTWVEAEARETVLPDDFHRAVGFFPRFNILPRPIPLLYERERAFDGMLNDLDYHSWDSITVPAGQSHTCLFHVPHVTNAYVRFPVLQGGGGRLSFTWFERFTHPEQEIKRTDWQNGSIEGVEDSVRLPASMPDGGVVFEPFWFRTFRFVRVVVEAAGEPVVLAPPVLWETGYPLEVESAVSSSQPWVEQVWRMCLNTLQGCMTETYMDCPFYEQQQFVMDTRLQALFTYTVTGDTQLARKALEDYHCSMLPEGLIHGKYPCAYPQIISTFSLHYIYMQWEYYLQTGDASVLRRYRADTDTILEYYHSRIDGSGLVGRLGYWEFIDWQPTWNELPGRPAGDPAEPVTITNLMYAYALECAAEICGSSGRPGLAEEYRQRRQSILDAVQTLCWEQGRGLYRDGPHLNTYSQHAQAWAVLNGMAEGPAGKALLERALTEADVVPCSFSTSYELFRALEAVGLYGETQRLMARWAGLLEWDCTTCPEEPTGSRSECHAWSALPMYELVRAVAGIKQCGVGWETIQVQPHMEYLPDMQGHVVTPKGPVHYSYSRLPNGMRYELALPEGLTGEFVFSDGRRAALQSGSNVLTQEDA